MTEKTREAALKRMKLDSTNLNEFARNAQGRIRAMTEEFFQHATPGDLSTMEVLLREHNTETADQGDSLAIAMSRLINGDTPLETVADNKQAEDATDSDERPCTLHALRARLNSKPHDLDSDCAYLASVMDVETGLSTRDKAHVTVCERMLRENRGCDTPMEEFLSEFLQDSLYCPLSLEKFRILVEQTEEHFEDSMAVAQKMAADYPELVIAGSKEGR